MKRSRGINMGINGHVHYWVIDSDNVGVCRCGEVRDFGRLLRRNGVFAGVGRRGAKARKEAMAKRKRESYGK